MKNYHSPGDSLTVAAPATVTSGDGVLVGSIFGVANGDAASGADVVLSTVGVYTLPKTTADDMTVGAQVWWDGTAKEVILTATANTLIGVTIAAAGAGATTAKVRLNGAF